MAHESKLILEDHAANRTLGKVATLSFWCNNDKDVFSVLSISLRFEVLREGIHRPHRNLDGPLMAEVKARCFGFPSFWSLAKERDLVEEKRQQARS